MSDQKGCRWRAVFLAAGFFALAVCCLALIGAVSSWSEGERVRTKWPEVTATIQHCEVVKHRRSSGRIAYSAQCAVTFKAGGELVKGGTSSILAYQEHQPAWWGNPGVDELRDWIAAHPDGSRITVHYNPEWPPQAEPFPPLRIFDRYSNRLDLNIAGIAAIVGLGLIALPLVIPR
jgi:hypothetical protein